MEVASLSVSFNAGENRYRVINVSLEPSVADKTVRLAFVTPKGSRYMSEPLEIKDGKASFPVPSGLLDGKGRLYVQAVAYDGGGLVAKSRAECFYVEPSLDTWEYRGKTGVVSPEEIEDRIAETAAHAEKSDGRISALEESFFDLRSALDECAEKTQPPVLKTSLKGGKWFALGDGQTEENSHKTSNYASRAALTLGIDSVLNYGEDFSTVAKKNAADNGCMCERAKSLPDGADIITVFGGAEDMKSNIALGTAGSEDETTFCGAVASLCKTLIAKYPDKTLLFVTPVEIAGESSKNAAGLTVTDYAKAMKTVCAKYSVPVYDANSRGELYPPVSAHASLYTDGGYYLNDAGHTRLANGLLNFITSLASVKTEYYGETAPSTEPVRVTGIRLNKSTAIIDENESASVIAAVSPSNAQNKSVVWSASPDGITLVPNGKTCTFSGTPGTYTVTCTTSDGGFSASCGVIINALPVHVSSVTLDKTDMTVKVGKTISLTASVLPADADNKSVVWSTDSECVSLIPNGAVCTVLGVSEGSASVICTAADNGKTASCSVNVESDVISVTGIKIAAGACSVTQNETKTLTAAVVPTNATNTAVIWSAENANVSISPDGGKCDVTGVTVGTCIVTATSQDGGFSASCTVTVTAASVPVTGIQLSTQSLDVSVGERNGFAVSVLPSGATNKKVTWSVSNSNVSIATEENTGQLLGGDYACYVTGVSVGSSVVTVTTEDGGFSASCTVTVTAG